MLKKNSINKHREEKFPLDFITDIMALPCWDLSDGPLVLFLFCSLDFKIPLKQFLTL